MDFINIIGTLFDNSVEHVAALANQIKDLRLGKNQQDINEDIYNKIQSVSGGGGNGEAFEELVQRVTNLEQNPPEKIKHIFLTQVEYDALESYNKDTLYFIIEYHNSGSASHFGDTFPFILGGSSKFGDTFPITLD